MRLHFHITAINECSVLIDYSQSTTTQLLPHIGEVSHRLSKQEVDGILNVTPSFNSVLIEYLPFRITQRELMTYLENIVNTIAAKPTIDDTSSSIRLPVFYDERVGPDISTYQNKGISLDKLIEYHTLATYTIGAIGFTPGFAFMQGLNSKLQLPRLKSPRLRIPAGSVAIAENLTAVYPTITPGGWNIIGSCPLSLYDPARSPMIPFEVGMTVRFHSIDESEFIALGGVIPDQWC
ncbi:allophanate hydrolase [Vibrio sinensis]|uniref:Allophanate hydrolase n=1 Tax=Vibrio sinensis TaxID=2302434 RepID=A0A3A6QRY8_9VIBR|nr:allophanate hydrolase subunit 1 [Vibrio sinensis]RJX75525.1 allophanate hydrolase [Vibrio sinensis]